jgi:hypothetical protein
MLSPRFRMTLSHVAMLAVVASCTGTTRRVADRDDVGVLTVSRLPGVPADVSLGMAEAEFTARHPRAFLFEGFFSDQRKERPGAERKVEGAERILLEGDIPRSSMGAAYSFVNGRCAGISVALNAPGNALVQKRREWLGRSIEEMGPRPERKVMRVAGDPSLSACLCWTRGGYRVVLVLMPGTTEVTHRGKVQVTVYPATGPPKLPLTDYDPKVHGDAFSAVDGYLASVVHVDTARAHEREMPWTLLLAVGCVVLLVSGMYLSRRCRKSDVDSDVDGHL